MLNIFNESMLKYMLNKNNTYLLQAPQFFTNDARNSNERQNLNYKKLFGIGNCLHGKQGLRF